MTGGICIIVLLFLIFLPGIAESQELQIEPRDRHQGVITKVPFEGKYYFIKIVPVDTAATVPMPIYNPERRWLYAPPDSLWYFVPDSVMRYLPELKPDSLFVPEREP